MNSGAKKKTLNLIFFCHFSFSFSSMAVTRTGVMNGYPCFVLSIAMIGVCTAVIGDVAAQLGCFIYLKDSVNAIAFVALGTSVPGIVNVEPLSSFLKAIHTRLDCLL
jgi:hypothetical protein